MQTLRKILVATFFILLTAIPAATLLLPKRDFSQLENRSLAKAPKATVDNILDKSYMEKAETYFADHIVFRNEFARSKTWLELLKGSREIDGVFVCGDRLMENISQPDEGYTQNNAAAVNAFAENHPFLETAVMLVPTASEFYPDKAPPFAQLMDQTSYIQDFYGSLSHVKTVDAYTSLAAEAGSYIFYRTDHHWTSYGAYAGYTALAKALGYKAATPDTFNIEHASHSFLGTLYSKALTGEEWRDTIDLYTYASGNPVQEVVKYSAKNHVTYPSIFFRENLDVKDQYTVFLGGNDSIIKIRTSVENGKKLLIFKDSYANALMQFLPLHYEEIVLVDLRAFNGELSDYVDLRDFQQVLFLYNVGNFAVDNSLSKAAKF